MQLFVECQFKGYSSGRSKRSAELSKEELGPILAHRSMAVYEYYKLGSEYIGDDEWCANSIYTILPLNIINICKYLYRY